MTHLVPRSVRVVSVPDAGPELEDRARIPLANFRSVRNYILLGEPGQGKTEAFKEEAKQPGCIYVAARRFCREAPKHPEWGDRTLFIDGLDEIRAGAADPRTPLDDIKQKLNALGNPPFRLSCRVGSWLKPGDALELGASPGIGKLAETAESTVLALNPLTMDDVRLILGHRNDHSDQCVSDAEQFIREAFEFGLDVFLRNPQLLDVLIKSVNKKSWPDGPCAAFDHACRELAKERNTEHRDASHGRVLPSLPETLTAAGRLSALLLLSGKGGWTTTNADHPDVASLRDVADDMMPGDRNALYFALESGLFSGPNDVRVPVHRPLAEFLGASYLDGRIRDGASVRRVLSLLLGHDGFPLPDLRGLSGWLAALNPQARRMLIRVDPVAVAFNGDAGSFGIDERRDLFESLEVHAELERVWPSTVALGALAGGQGKSAIWDLTASPERSDARQQIVLLLLSGLSRMFRGHHAKGGVVPQSQLDRDRAALLEIVCDATWRSDVRCCALATLDQVATDNAARRDMLGSLLCKLEEGRLPDERNKLLGTLLDILYPEDLPPAEVWDHLAVEPHRYRFDAYQKFWTGLVDRSNNVQVQDLLESLCGRAAEVIPRLANHRLGNVVLKLLARGLDLFGDQLDVAKLHRWFELIQVEVGRRSRLISAGLGSHSNGHFDAKAENAIRAWLRSRPHLQYALIEFGLGARESEISQRVLDAPVGGKFLGDEAPAGFRHWCLRRSAELWDTRPQIARELASWAVREGQDWDLPLSDDEVAEAVRLAPVLREWNNKRLADKARRECEAREPRRQDTEVLRPILEQQQARLAAVRQQATELAEGRCPPALLHELAEVYMDGLAREGPGTGPHVDLAWWLDGDEALVEAALAGFRSLLCRDDLSDLPQIAELHEKGRLSYFALPFLAGMAEEERAGNVPMDCLDENGRRRALGFYLVSGLATKRSSPVLGPTVLEDIRPTWYLSALDSHPEAVADAMVEVHNARVRSKATPCQHLYDIGLDPEYRRVAALAVRRMFSPFPSRCSGTQVESLRLVLWAALENSGMSSAELRGLVRRRLARRGMDVAQRAQWLCAGLFVARERSLPSLAEYLETGRTTRVRHVVDFFVSDNPGRRGALSLDDWCTDEVAKLIQTLGQRLARPESWEGARFHSRDQAMQLRFVPLFTAWIRVLAGRADDGAADALESLVADPRLGAWQAEIACAQEDQAERRRVARREAPSLAQISQSLRGGAPASAADLVALTLDVLDRLSDRIRNGATDDWRQYWHGNHNTKPQQVLVSKHENECRDALLSDLRLALEPYAVDAHPEGQYAEDKRADIRVAAGSSLAIPIEVKKNAHREIWRAVNEQLVPKYVRAPESGGYGIYLVFWFGQDCMKVVPPHGTLPKTPAEMKERLVQQLEPGYREKIGIVVIDVSRPANERETGR